MLDFTNCVEALNKYKGSEKKKTLIIIIRGIDCLSDIRKVFYLEILKIRYDILKKAYQTSK